MIGEAKNLLSAALKAPYIRHRFNHPPWSLKGRGGYAKGEAAPGDAALIDRLIKSYRLRLETPTGQWSEIFHSMHGDIDAAIRSDDRSRIEQILRDPITSDLLFGFDSTAKSLRPGGVLRIEDRRAPALVADALVTLAEAIGARPVAFPENYQLGRVPSISPDDAIDQIERALGFELAFPNPYPGEYGLETKRGIISFRAPQALYQAWRISKLLDGIPNPRVLEIGGGLGRTALYARRFGIHDYTIVDIPVSSLAQGYFLGRTLGEHSVTLFGESGASDATKIMPPSAFLDGRERYHLVVNVDSLTEIGREQAERYCSAIVARAGKFLSINHEINEYTVASLLGTEPHYRMPYWMRRGYVEELVEFGRDHGIW